MFDFIGVATRLRVKKTAPKEVIEFLDMAYSVTLLTWPMVTPKKFGTNQVECGQLFNDLRLLLRGETHEFPTWNWRCKEDKGDYWLYESRASAEKVRTVALDKLIESYYEYLLLEPGEIVARYLMTPDALNEIIKYHVPLQAPGPNFEIDAGHEYKRDEAGLLCDPYHPLNLRWSAGRQLALMMGKVKSFERPLTPDPLDLPWITSELDLHSGRPIHRDPETYQIKEDDLEELLYA